MSYTPTPPSGYTVPPAPGARPGSVTVSAMLLHLVAALLVINAAIQVYAATQIPTGLIEDIYRDAGADAEMASSFGSIVAVFSYLGAAVYVLVAITFVVLGLFTGKGKQWARITAWVFSGLGICCYGCNIASAGANGMLSGMSGQNTSGIDQAEITSRLAEVTPAWVTPVSTVLAVVGLLALIAVAVLLALPPSNGFFRKPAPEWVPPTYPTV
ncbi:hypothetical protein QEZ54_12310 [Catellatospora sp. KI3]|uniref:hypothetical protein n=1 Tax=Catellatospora sp. KI3 TaxID=3041620 RepID=UPI002482492C|nr:hypothetical protein [Catellatospora sp. KI3]MDI1461758.1 hypothetical protein [Catellatospora sp. KI3]